MAISFVGSTSAGTFNGNGIGLTLTNISGLAEGDLVIVAANQSSSNAFDMAYCLANGTGGWTNLASLSSIDTDPCMFGVWAKFMGSTVDTTITVYGTLGASESAGAVAMAFRGVDRSRPFDVAVTTATG